MNPKFKGNEYIWNIFIKQARITRREWRLIKVFKLLTLDVILD